MAINKKLIRFKTLANFENNLAEGNILNTSIVFIEDAKKIWTRGSYYDCTALQEKVTHAELKSLRDTGNLIPGVKYRITDYVTEVANNSDARSAHHPFDIIVEALDENTLSEEAQAIQHEGDEYFANSNLTAWKLKYSIDNDMERFSWAHADVSAVTGEWYLNDYLLKTAHNTEDDFLPTEEMTINENQYTVIPIPGEAASSVLPSGIGYFGTQYSVEEFNEFVYVANEAPEVQEVGSDNSYNSYGESSTTHYNWGPVSEIKVYLHNNLVTTLYPAGGGWFEDYKCGLDARFLPTPEEKDNQYYYTPTYDSDWHNYSTDEGSSGVISGKYDWNEDNFSHTDMLYAIYDTSDFIYEIYDAEHKLFLCNYGGSSIIIIQHLFLNLL